MYRITAAKKTFSGVIWDAETNKPLARFKDGLFRTDDEAVAEKLKALGYKVTAPRGKGGSTSDEDEKDQDGVEKQDEGDEEEILDELDEDDLDEDEDEEEDAGEEQAPE